MDLDGFVSDGWSRHAADPTAVMASLPAGAELVQEPSHLAPLAALVVHVAGEHLGRWDDGIALLERLERHAAFDAATPQGKAVLRSLAVLELCAGRKEASARREAAARSGPPLPDASDRVRILAVAAAALAGQRRTADALELFAAAVDLAAYGPGKDDPAARALAVTGNNLAAELEERAQRTPLETSLMVLAATVGLRFWSVAGGWREVERAHYRLAKSHLAAGELARALDQAEACLEKVEANGNEPLELVFAREALARVALAKSDRTVARREAAAAEAAAANIADAGDRDYATAEVHELKAIVEA